MIVTSEPYIGLFRNKGSKMGRKKLDLTNQRSDKLVAVRFLRTTKQGAIWECKCDCGNIIEALAGAFNAGGKRSCGCNKHSQRQRQRERVLPPSTRHLIFLDHRRGTKTSELAKKYYVHSRTILNIVKEEGDRLKAMKSNSLAVPSKWGIEIVQLDLRSHHKENACIKRKEKVITNGK